ncbi:gluconate 2-dehydrogenase subunit 3 family protein [Natronomonas gomsonensis]|uniref:gluconate 2-dehydrogenase subunit 3 family protein n=1 Tax=Natronomonas gomsonensis TaxID=1046043 RepID=UPI0015B8CCD9|nr:gluconate 2-dehydrogenase subunit 3 family protein [Natronomonas gomsonensis]
MELTRRDATIALAALGTGGAAAAGLRATRERDEPPDRLDDDAVVSAMVALAEVLYPSELSGIEPFVETFVTERLEREGHGEALRATATDLNELAAAWHDAAIAELSPAAREELLREAGADIADEAPDGTTAERVRYFVINELLMALYTSPTGGELVGIENPQGHPGGTDTYQRGPPS